MNALEQEIIDKFQRLNKESKQRVLRRLTDTTQTTFDYSTWWAEVDQLQTDIRSHLGDDEFVGGLSLLDELREVRYRQYSLTALLKQLQADEIIPLNAPNAFSCCS